MGGPCYVTRRAEDGRWRCLQTRMRWPSEWSMALLNSDGKEGRGVRQTETQRSQWIQQPDLPFTGFHGKAATGVSGTVFWVKALPAVMARFSRASFDWAVHFPKEMPAARPPLMLWMSLQIIHGWQTGEQVVVQSIRLGPLQCHSKEIQVRRWRWEEWTVSDRRCAD